MTTGIHFCTELEELEGIQYVVFIVIYLNYPFKLLDVPCGPPANEVTVILACVLGLLAAILVEDKRLLLFQVP